MVKIKQGDISSPLGFLAQARSQAGAGGSFSAEQKLVSLVNKERNRLKNNLATIRIAILASHTLDHFLPIFEMRLVLAGYNPDIYTANFGTAVQSVFDDESELYSFKPDIVWVFTTHREVGLDIGSDCSQRDVDELIERCVGEQVTLVDALRERCKATIILNNCDNSGVNFEGNYSASVSWSRSSLVKAYNFSLPKRVADNAVVFDFCAISEYFGTKLWVDNRYWHHSKHAFSFDAYGIIAHRFSRLVAAVTGRSSKCLVLDLDNTLWGGVIGDDGLEGIEIGNGSGADGEAFLEIQRYAESLRQRGILLAVCSKNEFDAAQSPFLEHPDMILKLDDFASFKANWENKAKNLQEIADELNIRTDSLVFLDDNPAERGLIRDMLPEVYVPEVSDDPSDYVMILDEMRLFETVSLGEEDRLRAGYYTANRKRAEKKASYDNLDDYLESLNMEVVVTDTSGVSRSRAIQLMNKSNQFNLNGAKISDGELNSYLKRDGHYSLCFRLKDKFGDNGIISVVMFKIDQPALIIDNWVMSCRVLSRGMEQVVIDTLVDYARLGNVDEIHGHWRNSKKNKLVAKLYERLSFTSVEDTPDFSQWKANLSDLKENKIIKILTDS